MKLKTTKPSASYQLALPEDICEQYDGRVCSFWLDRQPLVLQFSSYLRESGEQLEAQDRLRERIDKQPQQWEMWKSRIYPDVTVDQATAEFVDENGCLWIHTYLVWPHLTIYATISGPKDLARAETNWAVAGLRSLQLSVQ